MNEILRHQRRVGRELDHLGRGDVGADDRRVDAVVEGRNRIGVGRGERADHDPVGLHEVLDRRALRRELGVRDVADVTEPACVEPVSGLRAGADRNGALHRDDDALLDVGQLVDHCPHGRQVGVARVGRRGPHRDVDEFGAVHGLDDVRRERDPFAVSLEQLVEARLVDRHLAAAQRIDLLGNHVADDHAVPELREAGAGHQTDVPCAEHGDPLVVGPHDRPGG